MKTRAASTKYAGAWTVGTSVMIDGSHLPFGENIAITAEVVAAARPYGAWVEGALGLWQAPRTARRRRSRPRGTDPNQAAQFVVETGVDALAVSIGNVHGMTAAPARLDLGLLRMIRDRTSVPLVLHGASGVPDTDLRSAIDLGVAKVNVNAEVRRAYILGWADASSLGVDDLTACGRAAIDAAAAVVVQKLAILGRRESSRPGEATTT